MNKKDDNKKKIDLIVKIILIIVIVILLLHNCCLISKEKKENAKVPTGNVDIIEITCDKEDVCKVNESKKNIDDKNDDNNNEVDNTSPVSGDDTTHVDDVNELIVYDKTVTWHGDTPANIFTNSMYELTDRIAPESYNTYQFVVKNGTEYNLKYKIDFVESNPYSINMKYKLKKNNAYIIDHYVTASELNVTDILLNAKTNDTYYLEWKWISSDNDTEIGANHDSKYGLKINIEAESTND